MCVFGSPCSVLQLRKYSEMNATGENNGDDDDDALEYITNGIFFAGNCLKLY